MFSGNVTLHVLVASDFDGACGQEPCDTAGENVIVAETRVVSVLGPGCGHQRGHGYGGQQKETNMSVSLEKTSHPGRPGPDKLVPSRYPLRVGEIDVLVISDGVFPLPAATLATNADPAELAAWLDDRLQPADVFKWPLNVVVVRSGGRTVLIDSGVGSEFPDFPQVGRLATRLDAAGIDPASVTDVVLTHLHVDHVGGLLADGLRGRLRPDVPIHLASGGDRLTFLGDAVFPNHFDRPDWYNAFDHDPEEAVRVRVRLLRELAATRELLVAGHLSFPSVGRVAVAGDVFRFVPATWEH